MTAIDDKIRDRIAKVQALVNQGVDGEKLAAKTQLEKLLKKYNINPAEVENITKKEYFFKYATQNDIDLFMQLVSYFVYKTDGFRVYKNTYKGKELSIKLDYLDYVTLSCAYEYFKRHMNIEWKKFSADLLKKKRTAKTKTLLRNELQKVFYHQYIIKSGIYHPEQVKEKKIEDMSQVELENYNRLLNIEGGKYHQQVEKETLKIA